MRVSTLLCLSMALLLVAPGALAQSKYNFPMGHDRASGLQPTSTGTMDAIVLPNAQPMRGPGINESFNDITTLPTAGWSLQNLSDEVGTTTWFQGNATVFPSNSGDPTAYIGANFNSTTGANTINTWLLTPETPLANGTTITFFTRTSLASAFPDRLEVRLSTAGASTNAGSDPTTVGDFTTLLLEINPTLANGGYPNAAWEQFTVTLSGLAAPTTGRVGFRYFVTDGGPSGNNSNFIGIDDVVVAGAIAGPSLSVSPAAVTFGNVTTGTTADQTITLTNNGGAALTIASVAYTGDPSVTITQPGSLSLAAGASTTMMATFAPTATGAAAGTITITSDAPNSPTTVAVTGNGTAPSNALTFPSTDTPLTIPDNNPAGITSTIVVPAGTSGSIADLDVDLRITHTWVGDLIATVSNGTASATLLDRPGLPTTPAGCSANNVRVFADDEGTAGALETACEGLTTGAEAYTTDGRYTPSTPLTAFDAATIAGTYTLTISDNVGADLGMLNSWALLISPVTSSTSGPAGLSSLTVAPNPLAGQGQVSLTVASAQDVRVALYDVTGREVMTLLDRPMTAGQQAHIAFQTQALPAGVYVLRATGTDVSLTERVTVVR